jgi:hypothetical protein
MFLAKSEEAIVFATLEAADDYVCNQQGNCCCVQSIFRRLVTSGVVSG